MTFIIFLGTPLLLNYERKINHKIMFFKWQRIDWTNFNVLITNNIQTRYFVIRITIEQTRYVQNKIMLTRSVHVSNGAHGSSKYE